MCVSTRVRMLHKEAIWLPQWLKSQSHVIDVSNKTLWKPHFIHRAFRGSGSNKLLGNVRNKLNSSPLFHFSGYAGQTREEFQSRFYHIFASKKKYFQSLKTTLKDATFSPNIQNISLTSNDQIFSGLNSVSKFTTLSKIQELANVNHHQDLKAAKFCRSNM